MQVYGTQERLLVSEHPDTLKSEQDLADSYKYKRNSMNPSSWKSKS